MAALLVMLGVMLVLMSAALPAWRFQARREKEAELIFRGEQIARSVYLYQRKNGPGAFPPSLDVLVQGRYLRKKYKDPMTKDGEFQLLLAGMAPQGRGRGNQPQQQQPQVTGINQPGIIGVQSKSKEASIRTYMGRTRYNEWQFNSANVAARMGGPGRGRGIGPDGQPFPGAPGIRGPRGRGNDRRTPGMPTMPGPGRGFPGPGGRGPVRNPGQ
jgi:hypothetical protein